MTHVSNTNSNTQPYYGNDYRSNGHSNGRKQSIDVTSTKESYRIPNEMDQGTTVSHVSNGILKRPLEEGELSAGRDVSNKKRKTVQIFTDPESDTEIKSINASVESLFARLNEEIQDKKERLFKLKVEGWNLQKRLSDVAEREEKHKESEIQLKVEQEKFSKEKEMQQTQLRRTAEWTTRVDAKETKLNERERELESKEAIVAKKSEEIEELKIAYTQQVQNLMEQENKLKEKEAYLNIKEEKLNSKKEEIIRTMERLKEI